MPALNIVNISPSSDAALERLQQTRKWSGDDWLSIVGQLAAIGIPTERMSDLLVFVLANEVN
jgi:hypothetical protein